MSEGIEKELKLELPADEPRLDLSALDAAAEGGTLSLVSTYYDTPGNDLKKAGFSLRVRKSNGRHVQTVKAQRGPVSGLFVRPEWEQDIAGTRPVLSRAGPLAEAVGAEALRHLGRAFVTEIERKVHKVRLGGATILIADDCGEVRAGRHVEQVREVELELERGDPRAIFALAKRLGDHVPLRLGVRSKSERGYLLREKRGKAVKAEPIDLAPDDSTASAFETIAHACIRQYRLNETSLMAKGTPEPLHQARVGLRRLRSAFSVFGPMFAEDGKAQLLRAELRWLAAALGDVRDLDVLIPRLPETEGKVVTERRVAAFDRALAEVDSARTRILMLDLSEWLAFGDWRTVPADPALSGQDIAVTARAILKARRKTLKRRGRHLIDLPDAERHELRKQAKKLRYATEFFAALYPGSADYQAFLEQLQAFQDDLGELNDLATIPELLGRLGLDAGAVVAETDRAELVERAHRGYRNLVELKRFW